ncbi:MAG: hypothetical protein JSU59_12060 [Nitrospirota bacterium]|nr:MAG: hypothetical protein JSU59_12060 [Nitrospirota bacterium]
MTLFPIAHPRLGLSITTDSVCLVEIKPTLRGRVFRQLAHQALPEGLVQLSSTKPNISDPDALSEVLRVLTKGYRKPQPIVLSLPDVAGRTALFEFKDFPKNLPDREAILNWRFQQDINLSTKNARIGFRLYEPQKQRKRKPAQSPSLRRVLATAVPNTIIEQYEMACLKAGLLPLGVGLSSLDVLDLFRAMIQETSQTATRRSQKPGRESLFLYLAGWGFSFIALREGIPAFVRVKSLRLVRPQEMPPPTVDASLMLQNPTSTLGSQPFADPKGSSGNLEPKSANVSSASGNTRMLTNELVATLQYYLESFQTTSWEGQALPLYMAEGMEQGGTLLPAIQDIESILKTSMLDSPPINLLTFSEHLKATFPAGDKLTPYTYQKALPAYASVMVSS